MAINSPIKDKYSLKAARYGQIGAAPLDKGAQARMQELMGGAGLTQVWGMTETCCVATRFPWPSFDTTGSVGTPLPNLDIKLVDDAGKDITDFDVRGELCIRGPTVIRGYFENPEANKRDFDEDGYFHTGDIAYVSRISGLYYIVDRKKVGLPESLDKAGSESLLTAILRNSSKSAASKSRRPNSKVSCSRIRTLWTARSLVLQTPSGREMRFPGVISCVGKEAAVPATRKCTRICVSDWHRIRCLRVGSNGLMRSQRMRLGRF